MKCIDFNGGIGLCSTKINRNSLLLIHGILCFLIP